MKFSSYSRCCKVLMLIHFSVASFAQTDSIKKQEKRVRISPLPVVLSTPETKLGFGAAVGINFETGKVKDAITRTSYLQNFAIYTINHQYIFGNVARIYSPQNKFIFYNLFNYTYFPEYYFGISTEAPLQHKDTIAYKRITSDIRFYRALKDRRLYVGLASRFNNISDVNGDKGNFAIDNPLGHRGYWVEGLAPAFTIETRDNFVYPRKGFYLEALYYVYPNWGGNSYSFQQLKIDVRKYFPLQIISPIDVIALQFFAGIYTGDVPFKDMADLGGASLMRGYYSGFYRYKNLFAFQAEYRAMVTKRLGFAMWLGGALTPRELSNFFENSFKPNAGLGLRVMINTRDRLNIRLDQGFGKEGQNGFYTDMTEAF